MTFVDIHSADVKFADIKMDNGRSTGVGSVRYASVDDARRAVGILSCPHPPLPPSPQAIVKDVIG